MPVQLGAHPFFRSFMERAKVLGNNPVVEKVGNLREDIRERWETTDNPTVQRFQVSRRQRQFVHWLLCTRSLEG